MTPVRTHAGPDGKLVVGQILPERTKVTDQNKWAKETVARMALSSDACEKEFEGLWRIGYTEEQKILFADFCIYAGDSVTRNIIATIKYKGTTRPHLQFMLEVLEIILQRYADYYGQLEGTM